MAAAASARALAPDASLRLIGRGASRATRDRGRRAGAKCNLNDPKLAALWLGPAPIGVRLCLSVRLSVCACAKQIAAAQRRVNTKQDAPPDQPRADLQLATRLRGQTGLVGRPAGGSSAAWKKQKKKKVNWGHLRALLTYVAK